MAFFVLLFWSRRFDGGLGNFVQVRNQDVALVGSWPKRGGTRWIGVRSKEEMAESLSYDWWRTPKDKIIMGNDAAKKMWLGFDQVGRVYYEEFGRPPTIDELEECFRFCISPMKKGEYEYDHVLGCWKRPEEKKG